MRYLFLIGLVCGSFFLKAQFQSSSTNPLLPFVNGDPYLSLAIDLMERGQYSEAIKYLKKNKSGSEKTYESFFLIGYAYKLNGKNTEAITYFKKATHDQNMSLIAHFELGNCYVKEQIYAPAVFHFSKVIAIDSTFLAAYNNRAFARIMNFGNKVFPEDQLIASRKDLYKVLSMTTDAPTKDISKYFFNVGMIELYLNHYAAAIDNLKKATEFSPENGRYYYHLGVSQFLGKKYIDAAESFKMADYLGYIQTNTEEFLKVIDLVKNYWETQMND